MTKRINISPVVLNERAEKMIRQNETKEIIVLALGEIKNLEIEKMSLQNQLRLGIISKADVANERNMINVREQALKAKLVDSIHVTAKGAPRSIVHHAPTKSYPNGYVYTKLEGKKVIKAQTKILLYEKLFDHYYGKITYTVADIFEMALAEKRDTENLKNQTVIRYINDFKRYICDDLKAKDITTISGLDLKRYTQQLVNDGSAQLTKKQYLTYKGILNIIFTYVLRHNIITVNPVTEINNKAYLKSCDTSETKPEEKMFSEEEVNLLVAETRRRMDLPKWSDYYPLGFALIFSSMTGCRIGELCAVKWCDVDEENQTIHFHAQQIVSTENGHVQYVYDNHTKNEKGLSQSGRYFPLYEDLSELLSEIKSKQMARGIHSEFIFCLEDGSCITVHSYTRFLRRICKHVGIQVTNNHAFRMGFNSNILIPLGFTAVERAELLGHSVETNLKHYSFVKKNYLETARNKLNIACSGNKEPQRNPYDVIPFQKKKPTNREFIGFSSK